MHSRMPGPLPCPALPAGLVGLQGFEARPLFLRGLLDKLHVQPIFFARVSGAGRARRPSWAVAVPRLGSMAWMEERGEGCASIYLSLTLQAFGC